MRLIRNWRRCLVHAWSTRLIALGFVFEALLQVWNLVPPEVRSILPHPYGHIISLVCFAGAFGARVVHQPKLKQEAADAAD